MQQEVSDIPLTSSSLTNGDLEEDEASEVDGIDGHNPAFARPFSTHSSNHLADDVELEPLDPNVEGVEGRAAALVAAARAGGHPCSQCDRVFMSMQGLRSHERSHSAMALFSKEDKYSCQYCHFVSPFRHK